MSDKLQHKVVSLFKEHVFQLAASISNVASILQAAFLKLYEDNNVDLTIREQLNRGPTISVWQTRSKPQKV